MLPYHLKFSHCSHWIIRYQPIIDILLDISMRPRYSDATIHYLYKLTSGTSLYRYLCIVHLFIFVLFQWMLQFHTTEACLTKSSFLSPLFKWNRKTGSFFFYFLLWSLLNYLIFFHSVCLTLLINSEIMLYPPLQIFLSIWRQISFLVSPHRNSHIFFFFIH